MIWDAQHAINVRVQMPFLKTEKDSTLMYTRQVPGEEPWKKIWNRIAKTDGKVAKFSSEKINISWP
jgi:hypothetical protein